MKGKTILDYICLLLHYFKPLGMQKTEMRRLVRDIKQAIKEFGDSLDNRVLLFKIVGSDYQEKLEFMDKFITK